MSNATKINFEYPPVVEVVCGAFFAPLERLSNRNCVEFWSNHKDDFPHLEEVDPLYRADNNAISLNENIMPRYWLVSEDEQRLIQIQRDSFLYNWRKLSSENDYPRYENIFPRFYHYLKEFEKHASTSGAGTISIVELELSYINRIRLNDLDAVGLDFTKLFNDHKIHSDAKRFLPLPSGFKWLTMYDLANGRGKLNVTAQSAIDTRTKEKLIQLEFSARCPVSGFSIEDIGQFFDEAHKSIIYGFVDFCNNDAQKLLWRKQ